MIEVTDSKMIRKFGFEDGVLSVVIKGDTKKDGETKPDVLYTFDKPEAGGLFVAMLDTHTNGGSVGRFYIANLKSVQYASKTVLH